MTYLYAIITVFIENIIFKATLIFILCSEYPMFQSKRQKNLNLHNDLQNPSSFSLFFLMRKKNPLIINRFRCLLDVYLNEINRRSLNCLKKKYETKQISDFVFNILCNTYIDMETLTLYSQVYNIISTRSFCYFAKCIDNITMEQLFFKP